MTSSLLGSLPPFFLSAVPLSSPPSHVSYVLATAENLVSSQVPKMKLVGDSTGGTSHCTPSSFLLLNTHAGNSGRDVHAEEADKG